LRGPPSGFRFAGKLGTHDKDPFYGFSHLRQLYWKENTEFKGHFIIPMLWDRKTEVVVSNESNIIMRMLEESFDHLLLKDRQEVNCPGGGLYLEVFRPKIKAMNK
jgi:putative glutathione S-transferase